ncbi:MAG: T9SS type A sorting domain-containing protein [Candidatus Marinimicrobia bacterium]|nr:T9SS type A sorting domain-containing protein [Candidatus Neomarinimicrobiota bacterium]
MKRLLMILPLLFFWVVPTIAQSLSVRITNARVEGGNFKWDVEIKRTDDWGGGSNNILGNCDFYFYVNKDGFTSDDPTTSNIHASLSGNTNYGFRTGRSGGNAQCWVALDYNSEGGGSNWYPPLNSWEHLFTASLPIADPNEQSGLTWHETSTGFSRGNSQPLTKTLSGDGDISLPVELSSFSAISERGAVILRWTTESEIENLGFILERRIMNIEQGMSNAEEWKEIASYLNNPAMLGQGSVSHKTEYSYKDSKVQPGITYEYRLADVSYDGVVEYHGIREVTVKGSDEAILPEGFALRSVYPNPFNPEANISYAIGEEAEVDLVIVDLLGREVKQLLNNEVRSEGNYTVKWDGTNDSGFSLSSGVYFVVMKARGTVDTQKIVLFR